MNNIHIPKMAVGLIFSKAMQIVPNLDSQLTVLAATFASSYFTLFRENDYLIKKYITQSQFAFAVGVCLVPDGGQPDGYFGSVKTVCVCMCVCMWSSYTSGVVDQSDARHKKRLSRNAQTQRAKFQEDSMSASYFHWYFILTLVSTTSDSVGAEESHLLCILPWLHFCCPLLHTGE